MCPGVQLGGPAVKLGRTNAAQAVPCEAVELAVLNLQTELANFFIDETNKVLQEFVGMEQSDEGKEAIGKLYKRQTDSSCGGALVVPKTPQLDGNSVMGVGSVPDGGLVRPQSRNGEAVVEPAATESPKKKKRRSRPQQPPNQPRKKPCRDSQEATATEKSPQSREQRLLEVRESFHHKKVCFVERQNNNLAIIKCAKRGGHGAHQDFSHIIASGKDQPKFAAPWTGWFPTAQELMVVTFVFSAAPDDQAKRSVRWKRNGVVVAEVDTYANDCHLQGVFCNWLDLQHETVVKNSRAAAAGQGWSAIHIVFTARTAMLPRDNPALHLQQMILDKLSVPQLVANVNKSMLRYKHEIVNVAKRNIDQIAVALSAVELNQRFELVLQQHKDYLVELAESDYRRWDVLLPPEPEGGYIDAEAQAKKAEDELNELGNNGFPDDVIQDTLLSRKLSQVQKVWGDPCWWKWYNFASAAPRPQSRTDSLGENPKEDPPSSLLFGDKPKLKSADQVTLKKRLPYSNLPAGLDDCYHREHLPEALLYLLDEWNQGETSQAAMNLRDLLAVALRPSQVKGLRKPQHTIGIKRSSRGETSRDSTIVTEALMHNVIITVTDDADSQPTIFTVHDRPPPPGVRLRESEAPGKFTQNQHNIMDTNNPSGLTVVRHYKNLGPVEEHGRQMNELHEAHAKEREGGLGVPPAGRIFHCEKLEEKLKEKYNNTLQKLRKTPLEVPGPGGSTLVPGTVAPSSGTRFDDCHQGAGSKQSIDNPIIRAMINNCQVGAHVTLCKHDAKFKERKDKNKNANDCPDKEHPVTVLGGFRIKGFTSKELDFEELWELCKDADPAHLKENLPLLSYLLCGAIRFQMEPVCEWGHIRTLLNNWHAEEMPYESMSVSCHDKRPLAGPAGKLVKWVVENKCSSGGSLPSVQEEEDVTDGLIEHGMTEVQRGGDDMDCIDLTDIIDDTKDTPEPTTSFAQERKVPGVLLPASDRIPVDSMLEFIKGNKGRDGTVSRAQLLQFLQVGDTELQGPSNCKLPPDASLAPLVSPSKSVVQSPDCPRNASDTGSSSAASGEVEAKALNASGSSAARVSDEAACSLPKPMHEVKLSELDLTNPADFDFDAVDPMFPYPKQQEMAPGKLDYDDQQRLKDLETQTQDISADIVERYVHEIARALSSPHSSPDGFAAEAGNVFAWNKWKTQALQRAANDCTAKQWMQVFPSVCFSGASTNKARRRKSEKEKRRILLDTKRVIMLPIHDAVRDWRGTPGTGGHFSCLVIDRRSHSDGIFMHLDSGHFEDEPGVPTCTSMEEIKSAFDSACISNEKSIWIDANVPSQGPKTRDCGPWVCLLVSALLKEMKQQHEQLKERHLCDVKIEIDSQGFLNQCRWLKQDEVISPKLAGWLARAHVRDSHFFQEGKVPVGSSALKLLRCTLITKETEFPTYPMEDLKGWEDPDRSCLSQRGPIIAEDDEDLDSDRESYFPHAKPPKKERPNDGSPVKESNKASANSGLQDLLNAVGLKHIHPTWIKKGWIIDYLLSETNGEKAKFKQLLQKERDPNPDNGPYRFTPKQFLTALAVNSGIGAVRADPLQAAIPAAKLNEAK